MLFFNILPVFIIFFQARRVINRESALLLNLRIDIAKIEQSKN